LERCFAALAPTSCETLTAALFENVALPSECDGLHGQGKTGTPCAGADQCASAVCVEQAPYVADDDACGQCGAGTAAGGACETLRDCARGLTCANKVCIAYGAEGDACDDGHPCHATLHCAKGACAPLVAAGGACTASPPSCALDLECNAKIGKCTHPVATGGTAGARCGVSAAGDYDACAHGYICSFASDGTGQCLPLANEGDECADRPCAAPLRCVHATCRLQDANACH
jgi:hypothetical protein